MWYVGLRVFNVSLRKVHIILTGRASHHPPWRLGTHIYMILKSRGARGRPCTCVVSQWSFVEICQIFLDSAYFRMIAPVGGRGVKWIGCDYRWDTATNALVSQMHQSHVSLSKQQLHALTHPQQVNDKKKTAKKWHQLHLQMHLIVTHCSARLCECSMHYDASSYSTLNGRVFTENDKWERHAKCMIMRHTNSHCGAACRQPFATQNATNSNMCHG